MYNFRKDGDSPTTQCLYHMLYTVAPFCEWKQKIERKKERKAKKKKKEKATIVVYIFEQQTGLGVILVKTDVLLGVMIEWILDDV